METKTIRIIGGKYRGKKLFQPETGDVRPMVDRLKESLFNILSTKVYGSVVLDLFGGSGGLGLEALSRGAGAVYIADKHPLSIRAMRKNVESLKQITHPAGAGCVMIINNDYLQTLNDFFSQKLTFDIIFLDPPYASDFAEQALKKIKEYGLLNKGGVIVWHHLAVQKIKNCPFAVNDERVYGEKMISFLN